MIFGKLERQTEDESGPGLRVEPVAYKIVSSAKKKKKDNEVLNVGVFLTNIMLSQLRCFYDVSINLKLQ